MGWIDWISCCCRRRDGQLTNQFEKAFEQSLADIKKTERLYRDAKRAGRYASFAVWRSGVAIWGISLSMLYLRVPLPFAEELMPYRVAKKLRVNPTLPWVIAVFVIPIVLYLVASASSWYYRRKADRLQSRAIELRDLHEQKVNEFKSLTNFSKLNDLVSRFDETPKKQQLDADIEKKEQQAEIAGSARTRSAEYGPKASSIPSPGFHTMLSEVDVQRLRKRGIADRILDFVLNDGPNNRYALICANCSCHNGLVLHEDLESTRYVCSMCGHLNGGQAKKLITDDSDVAANLAAAGHEMNEETDSSTVAFGERLHLPNVENQEVRDKFVRRGAGPESEEDEKCYAGDDDRIRSAKKAD